MDATTILGGLCATLASAVGLLFKEMRKQAREHRAERRELMTQIETKSLQWTEEVKERSLDAARFLTVLERRRMQSSAPPGSSTPTHSRRSPRE